MFGKNPKRASVNADGTELEVQAIFKTIQGEGILVGVPAIFIRLGGCNLACTFCDTEFEDFSLMHIDNILQEISTLSKNAENEKTTKLVVITGGEPLRQPIELFCETLLNNDFQVQIETNGTLYRHLPREVLIICSPKAGKIGYTKIRPDLLPRINALKFIISKNITQYNNVPELGQTIYNIPVFVQPMDQNDQKLNIDNNDLAVKIALEKNYRLSVQVHKFLGID
jgi:organic radical activating enzyme